MGVSIKGISNSRRSGVIKTFGKTRPWRQFECQPGITLCYSFEELVTVQVKGGYIDLAEQTIMSKNNKMTTINSAIIYSIFDVRAAILETEDIEDLISGICMNEIREFARSHTIEDMCECDRLTRDLSIIINKKIKKYGAKVSQLMLTDLRPHDVALVCDTLKTLLLPLTQ